MDKVLAIAFVFCAFCAVFLGMHKEDIEEGRLGEVVASYIEG